MAQPRVIGDERLAAAAERAVDKLMASLPLSMRTRAASIRQRLFIDTTGWFGTCRISPRCRSCRTPYGATAQARWDNYRRADKEEVSRSIDPLGAGSQGDELVLRCKYAGRLSHLSGVADPRSQNAGHRLRSACRFQSLHTLEKFDRRLHGKPAALRRNSRLDARAADRQDLENGGSPLHPSARSTTTAGSRCRCSSRTKNKRASWPWGLARGPR